MRTTLTIDDDILLVVQERARRQRRSIGSVLSELARQGLNTRLVPAGEEDEFLGFRPLPARGGTVTNALIDSLREDELE